MPPIHLLQHSSSWQPQPKLSGSFRGASTGNVRREFATILVGGGATVTAVTAESASSPAVTDEPQESMPDSLKPEDIQDVESNIGPDLRQLIISRIRNGGNGPELEVFSNVSEDDYTYILDVIRLDCSVIRKLRYIPRLQKLIATLPSPIHEAILVPLRTAMGITIDSLTIPDDFDISLPIHMARMLDAPATSDLPPDESYRLRIPDLVLMLQTRDADILPLWPFEVSVSETSESAVGRLQTYGDRNKNILAATHINIVEARTHVPPTYEWGIEKGFDQRGIQIKDLTHLEDGGVASLSHTWYHPTTVTITTWIRPPNKCLNLNSRQCAYYTTALLYPNQDNKGLQKVERIFKRTLEIVRDTVVSHLQTVHEHDQVLLSSLQVVRDWSPPSKLLNWDKCNRDLWAAAKQMGFDRYHMWHRRFLKRVADEEYVPSAGPSKRAKRA
ncbi:uncharacterized protein F5147DRAFT_798869 [Suillus discolor]|uniref:Uncharacterized protein n=1 Tax=Suillus discolor TaxID=1912936 RepID=A0A9P7F939_9AGAM|nr:uncharacterized protein F5147DRAFT_798869 [Suillus discolor]KAG2108926.1 hypothetical protein F5147DRAFT_798869 [Suillus discolor]